MGDLRASAVRTRTTLNAPVAATISQPASKMPSCLLIAPKKSANGRNAIQVSDPTADATPARTFDGIPSCSSRVNEMLSEEAFAKQGGGWLAAVAVVIVLACIAVQDGHDESEEEEAPLFEDIDIE